MTFTGHALRFMFNGTAFQIVIALTISVCCNPTPLGALVSIITSTRVPTAHVDAATRASRRYRRRIPSRWFVATCMKILYIASERSDAHLAARSLRGISPDFKLLWASNLERAALCLLEFSDVAALVVEVRSDSAGCLHLKRARELGLKAPVVVVLPDGAGSPAESLEAGVDSYLAKNQSFSRELPVVVTRAIERAQTSARVVRGDQLPSGTVGESAAGVPADRPIARKREPSSTASECARCGPPTSPIQRRVREYGWEKVHARAPHKRTRNACFTSESRAGWPNRRQQPNARKLSRSSSIRNSRCAPASSRSLRTPKLRSRMRSIVTRQPLRPRPKRWLSVTHSTEVGMARVTSTWDTVDEQLRQWALEVERARQGLASSAATEVARLTEREAELTAQLAEAAATRRDLEAQLIDARTALTGGRRARHS